MLLSPEAKWGHLSPWSLSYRWLYAPWCGCGELNLGLLQVHQVPFTSGPFPQLLEFIFNLQYYYQARSNACNDFEGGHKMIQTRQILYLPSVIWAAIYIEDFFSSTDHFDLFNLRVNSEHPELSGHCRLFNFLVSLQVFSMTHLLPNQSQMNIYTQACAPTYTDTFWKWFCSLTNSCIISKCLHIHVANPLLLFVGWPFPVLGGNFEEWGKEAAATQGMFTIRELLVHLE